MTVYLDSHFSFFFRDAVSDLALHFLAKMKIMVVKDIERDDIEFVCKVRIGLVSFIERTFLEPLIEGITGII